MMVSISGGVIGEPAVGSMISNVPGVSSSGEETRKNSIVSFPVTFGSNQIVEEGESRRGSKPGSFGVLAKMAQTLGCRKRIWEQMSSEAVFFSEKDRL